MNTITGHVTIMHGNADRIVPVENAYFAEKYLQQAQLDMLLEDDRDHFLPFERPYTIEAALRAMYTSISL